MKQTKLVLPIREQAAALIYHMLKADLVRVDWRVLHAPKRETHFVHGCGVPIIISEEVH